MGPGMPLDEGLARADDHATAARTAAAAGRLLLELRGAVPPRAAGRGLGADGDRNANRLILDLLAAGSPDDAVLSEEAADSTARLESERVWVVDPLDGTREFSEHRDDWAVHVALAVGGILAAGAVALPARDLVLATGTAQPSSWPPLGGRSPRMVVSRSRAHPVTGRIREAIGAELVPLGSAGAKAMAVVLGEADVYAHAGGMYEWDHAAPAAVAASAGLWVSRLDGRPLRYNRKDPWSPDLLICRPELADAVLAAV